MTDTYEVVDMMDVPDTLSEDSISYTNFGCFAVDPINKHTFCLKTHTVDGEPKKNRSQLRYYESYTGVDPYKPKQKLVLQLGHGNTMALTEKYIYFVVSYEKTVRRISRKNVSMGKNITEDIILPFKTTSLTYYSGKEFIVKIDNHYNIEGDYYEVFRYVTLVTNANGKKEFKQSDGRRDFAVRRPATQVSNIQDIFYKKGFGLFLPLPYKTLRSDPEGGEGANLVKNKIMKINIDGNPSQTINNINIYQAVDIDINRSPDIYEKYEIESVAFSNKNNLLFCGNFKKVNKNSTDKIKCYKKV